MSGYKKKLLLVEGKTKRIYSVFGHDNLCIIESKNTITANDNPALTKEFATKAKCSNITNCNVFELLKRQGIPVSYREQISDTEFLAEECVMIPLEVIGRRYAMVGSSYLKRKPNIVVNKIDEPHTFNDLCVEFFLKTSEGKCKMSYRTLISGLKVEDPFILNPYDSDWKLYEPKMPYSNPNAFLRNFDSSKILNGSITIQDMELLLIRVIHELERAFIEELIRFIDIKIEFGINSRGELVVSDVIDNDSWRITTLSWEDISKQCHRMGHNLSDIEKNYLYVAALTDKFVK